MGQASGYQSTEPSTNPKGAGTSTLGQDPFSSYLGTPGPRRRVFHYYFSVPPSHPRGSQKLDSALLHFVLTFVLPFLLARSLSLLLFPFFFASSPLPPPRLLPLPLPPDRSFLSPRSLGFPAPLTFPRPTPLPRPSPSARSLCRSQSARGLPRPRPPAVPGGPGGARAAGAEGGAAGRGPMGPGGRAARARGSPGRGRAGL